MSSELEMNEDTIRTIVRKLDESIAQLVQRQQALIKVDGQAFGASPGGTSAHQAANRAHEALDETLDLLRTAHDEFSESLRALSKQIQQTDDESREFQSHLSHRLAEIKQVRADNVEIDRLNAEQGAV